MCEFGPNFYSVNSSSQCDQESFSKRSAFSLLIFNSVMLFQITLTFESAVVYYAVQRVKFVNDPKVPQCDHSNESFFLRSTFLCG